MTRPLRKGTFVVLIVTQMLACDVLGTLASAPELPYLHESLADYCCSCLAESTITQSVDAPACETLTVERGSDDVVDADCLCDMDAESCRDALVDDKSIRVLASCVDEDGPCHDRCDGLLAYPSNES